MSTSVTTAGLSPGSFAVETTPAGLFTAQTSCASTPTGLPSTRTSLSSSTSRAGSVTTLPSTVMRPLAMIFSAIRREATPPWARYLARRTRSD